MKRSYRATKKKGLHKYHSIPDDINTPVVWETFYGEGEDFWTLSPTNCLRKSCRGNIEQWWSGMSYNEKDDAHTTIGEWREVEQMW